MAIQHLKVARDFEELKNKVDLIDVEELTQQERNAVKSFNKKGIDQAVMRLMKAGKDPSFLKEAYAIAEYLEETGQKLSSIPRLDDKQKKQIEEQIDHLVKDSVDERELQRMEKDKPISFRRSKLKVP